MSSGSCLLPVGRSHLTRLFKNQVSFDGGAITINLLKRCFNKGGFYSTVKLNFLENLGSLKKSDKVRNDSNTTSANEKPGFLKKPGFWEVSGDFFIWKSLSSLNLFGTLRTKH
jgi:hypothetical protein